MSLGEARAFTDVFVGLRQIGEAGYLHAVQVQDTRERLAAAARRGRNATADALVLAYRIDPAQAVRDLAAARALDADTGALPALAAALLDGRVNRGHVDVAAGVGCRAVGDRRRSPLSVCGSGSERIVVEPSGVPAVGLRDEMLRSHHDVSLHERPALS